MKKRGLNTLRKKNVGELNKLVDKLRLELAKEKVKFRAGKLKKPTKLRDKKLEIAQALTLIREMEIVEKAKVEAQSGNVKESNLKGK